MRLLGPEKIDELNSRSGPDNFATRLVKQTPLHFVANARVSAQVLELDGQLIPVVLSDGNPDDSSVCSILAHYVTSPSSQMSQLENRWFSIVARPFLSLLRRVIETGRLGRVVYVNEWLMTTNPAANLSESDIERITDFLVSRFPNRAIVFRSNNQLTRRNLQLALVRRGYNLVRSRRIYMFHPRSPNFRMKSNLRKDLRLLRRWPGTIGRAPLNEKGLRRIADLYRGLYLGKYSSGNPDFTDEFFRTFINDGLFQFRYLEQAGEILAFTAWYWEKDGMLGTLVGYDLNMPRAMGLLRLAFAIDFREAIQHKVPYHVSSGVGHFKRLRGAVPTTENDAVFTGHLTRQVRVYWSVFRALMYLAERMEGEEIDFKKAPE